MIHFTASCSIQDNTLYYVNNVEIYVAREVVARYCPESKEAKRLRHALITMALSAVSYNL